MDSSALPVFLMLLCAVGLALGLLGVARVFTRGRAGAVQQMPYESGMDPIHDTRRRFDVRFHLLAIAFLIFDVELLFLFPWAVAWGGGGRATTDQRQGLAASMPIGPGRRQCGVPSTEYEVGRSSPAGARPQLRTAYSALDPPDAPRLPRTAANRHLMFAGAMMFLVLLAVGYVYDWRQGVFQWR